MSAALQTPAHWAYAIGSAGESVASYPGTVLTGTSPLAFGAKGDGVTDDSHAIQAAINANAGGGVVDLGSLRYAVNNSISIPGDVALRGTYGGGWIQGLNYYQLPSQLILGPGVTINMASRAAIVGLVITRAGLSMPAVDHASAVALIAQFNGTAITAAGADILMRDLFILGHTLGISASWSDPVNQVGGRYNIERVRGDCTNGIQVSYSFDISRVTNCHFWPFATAIVTGGDATTNTRSGIAFDTETCDWNRFVNCFAYGWNTNFKVFDGSNMTFIACDSDGPGPPNTYGWDIEGDASRPSDPIDLVGCTANSAPTILYCNQAVPTGSPTWIPTLVRTTGCRFAANTLCVHVMQGAYASCNDSFESGQGIYGENGTSGAIIGSVFRSIAANGYSFANAATAANWDIIAPRFTGGTVPPAVSNQLVRALNLPALQASTSYANDAAAAAGGVGVGQTYRNGSAVMIRVV